MGSNNLYKILFYVVHCNNFYKILVKHNYIIVFASLDIVLVPLCYIELQEYENEVRSHLDDEDQ